MHSESSSWMIMQGGGHSQLFIRLCIILSPLFHKFPEFFLQKIRANKYKKSQLKMINSNIFKNEDLGKNNYL